MTSVEVQPHDRLVALGKGDRLEHRIDDSFRPIPYGEIVDVAPARRVDLAVGVDDPPGGADAFHGGLARADLIEGLQSGQGSLHGHGQPIGRQFEETDLLGWATGSSAFARNRVASRLTVGAVC